MYRATLSIARNSNARTVAISSHGNTIALLVNQIDSRFTLEHASAVRNPDVIRLGFDGQSLRWDAEFELEALGAFATGFEATPSRS